MEFIFTGIIIIIPIKLNQHGDNDNNSPAWIIFYAFFYVHSVAEIISKTLQA